MYIYNIIINFFSHEMMCDINIFNTNIKLNIFCENYNFLIVIKNHDNFKIQIIKIKKLIKFFFQLNDFFDNLYLIDIFRFTNKQCDNNLIFK